MPKKKLLHFKENLSFPFLFQPKYPEIKDGFHLKGRWKEDFFGSNTSITLELGCGKGEYTVTFAKMHPNMNFIGIDIKGARLWKGCMLVQEAGLTNVAFIRTLINHLEQLFAPGEISEIWITFPDPQKKKEKKRLTSPHFLSRYARILEPEGIIHLKTDDEDLFHYTLDVVRNFGSKILWYTDDLYHSGISGKVAYVRTFYENIWLDQGKKICYLQFKI